MYVVALIPVNSDQLDEAIGTGSLVMVYFWTDWHEICLESTPMMEELGKKYEGQDVIICAMNADENGFRALELGVYSIPTVIVFQGCEEIDRISGIQDVQLYSNMIDAFLHPENLSPYELINSSGYAY